MHVDGNERFQEVYLFMIINVQTHVMTTIQEAVP